NFTDSIMLMKAAYPVENLIQSAFLNPSWKFINDSPDAPVDTLIDVMKNNRQADAENWYYPLYWHGYLVILKPALMISPVHDLRVLNFYVQFFLMLSALFLFYQRFGRNLTLAFALTLLTINPVTAAIDFQNSDVFCIILLSAIFILRKNEFLLRGENYLYFFLLLGIVTVYVDFLTYPFAAFGVSLCLCVLMNEKIFLAMPPKEILKKLSAYLFAWGFGYGGMWAGKWILASVLTGENVILSALGKVIYRTSTTLSAAEGGTTFTFIDVLARNFSALFRGPLPIILGLLLIYLIYILIRGKKKIFVTKSRLAAFAFIMLVPFLWYAVVKNHSYVHDYMTYRNLAVTIFAALSFFVERSD
ncbi:MAG: hypothetical protein IJU91_05020, partial [Selenomonadaceae bacterium]|nr:hypothetical protein [Selenomonadaceae bacterium]